MTVFFVIFNFLKPISLGSSPNSPSEFRVFCCDKIIMAFIFAFLSPVSGQNYRLTARLPDGVLFALHCIPIT